MRYGVIDLGSNTVKFLVAEKVGGGFQVIVEQSHPTRLAEDLIASAELKPEAMARTLALLSELRAQGDQLGVVKWMAVATSAVRDAKIGRSFSKLRPTVCNVPSDCSVVRKRPKRFIWA